MVTYSEDRKWAYYDGIRFCRDEKTGYYLNATIHKRLHRYVYEHEVGEIPDGLQVHHLDHDKGNNEPDNLALLTASQHQERHGKEMPDELREWHREHMLSTVIPAAKGWHGSEAGREWHRQHYAETRDSLHERTEKECEQCGKTFMAVAHGRFCSNACSSAWRRKAGIDNERRECVVCGAEFFANRYAGTKCCSRSCAMRMRHQNRRDQETPTGACV